MLVSIYIYMQSVWIYINIFLHSDIVLIVIIYDIVIYEIILKSWIISVPKKI